MEHKGTKIQRLHIEWIFTPFFGVSVFLFFGLAYPHHLHYQEQYQLFLFDNTYVWEIVKQPGGVADLLGRFCTQFFLYAWVGALIIALLLSAVQFLMLLLFRNQERLYGLSFVPSFLLWIFLLDENALLGGVWAIFLTLLAVFGIVMLTKAWIRRILLIVAIPILFFMVGPVCFPIPLDSLWSGIHYYRYRAVIEQRYFHISSKDALFCLLSGLALQCLAELFIHRFCKRSF